MTEEEINKILDHHLAQQTSESEKAFLESWYNSREIASSGEYTLEERIADSMLVWKSLSKDIPAKRTKLWPRITIAASLFLSMGLGVYLISKREKSVNEIIFSSNIKPGGNKAFLTLHDGRRITLDDAARGTLAVEAGITISKTAEGQLRYSVKGDEKAGLAYNTISTPNGGKYEVILPDGTQAWLNAASSLKFPASFATLKNRVVELSGEAYFEVAKDSEHPFQVQTARQNVKVLGTHFNINAYSDEPVFKTTLLEGNISLAFPQSPGQENILLKAGEQAQTSNGSTSIRKVDTENAIDWKNDEFYFKDMDFKTAMRKIARWYDIEVIYTPGVDTSFSPGGWISRKSSISSVLKMMESTGNVHFKADGRRITVTQ
jgi:transmembrane sensor